MNRLRMYTKPTDSGPAKQQIFYSRRGNGPFYRWLYEEAAKEWRVSRVIANDFSSNSLSMATWKAIPAALQSRLDEHYLD